MFHVVCRRIHIRKARPQGEGWEKHAERQVQPREQRVIIVRTAEIIPCLC